MGACNSARHKEGELLVLACKSLTESLADIRTLDGTRNRGTAGDAVPQEAARLSLTRR